MSARYVTTANPVGGARSSHGQTDHRRLSLTCCCPLSCCGQQHCLSCHTSSSIPSCVPAHACDKRVYFPHTRTSTNPSTAPVSPLEASLHLLQAIDCPLAVGLLISLAATGLPAHPNNRVCLSYHEVCLHYCSTSAEVLVPSAIALSARLLAHPRGGAALYGRTVALLLKYAGCLGAAAGEGLFRDVAPRIVGKHPLSTPVPAPRCSTSSPVIERPHLPTHDVGTIKHRTHPLRAPSGVLQARAA